MKEIVVITTSKLGRRTADISAISDWEEFDKLVVFLKWNYGAAD